MKDSQGLYLRHSWVFQSSGFDLHFISQTWAGCCGKGGRGYQAQGWQHLIGSWAVLGRVVAEDGGAVEGAVILGVVQPALGVVRAHASNAQPDDVR